MENRSAAISRLNAGHPMNLAAERLLGDYPVNDHRLQLLTLLIVSYRDFGTQLPRLKGSPSADEVLRVLGFLERADPEAVMQYLTVIGRNQELGPADLDAAESIPAGARKAMGVLLTQLALGAALPTQLDVLGHRR